MPCCVKFLSWLFQRAGTAEEGIIVIDQHAAHERILYEKLQNAAVSSPHNQMQQLLIPETIEVSFSGAVILEKLIKGIKLAEQ